MAVAQKRLHLRDVNAGIKEKRCGRGPQAMRCVDAQEAAITRSACRETAPEESKCSERRELQCKTLNRQRVGHMRISNPVALTEDEEFVSIKIENVGSDVSRI